MRNYEARCRGQVYSTSPCDLLNRFSTEEHSRPVINFVLARVAGTQKTVCSASLTTDREHRFTIFRVALEATAVQDQRRATTFQVSCILFKPPRKTAVRNAWNPRHTLSLRNSFTSGSNFYRKGRRTADRVLQRQLQPCRFLYPP